MTPSVTMYPNLSLTTSTYSLTTHFSGTFIRQGCGAFGEVASVGSDLQAQGFYNHIDHLFDCFGTGTNFKLQDGEATFTNK